MTLIATRLNHTGLLELHGPDAVKFLQGQTTNDVAACAPDRWQHGAHCTPKGRMIANFDLVRADEQKLLLRLPADALPTLQAALGKYIIFSKADLTDISDRYQRLGLLGDEPVALLQSSLGIDLQLDADHAVQTSEGSVFLRLDERRVECWLPVDQPLPEALNSLLDGADDSAARQWRLRDIELGRGWITAATSDGFLPQDLNLQTAAIAGVHFKKGCYTGQEIVARMHYKGKLKRHLYRLAATPPGEAAAGTPVLNSAGNTVGTVINAEAADGQLQLLAVLTEQAYSGNDGLQLPSASGLTGLPQPYAIEPV